MPSASQSASLLTLVACAALTGCLPGCASYPLDRVLVEVAAEDDGRPIAGALVAASPMDRRIYPLNPITAQGIADFVLRPAPEPTPTVRTGSNGAALVDMNRGLSAALVILAPGYQQLALFLQDPFGPNQPASWINDPADPAGRPRLKVRVRPLAQGDPSALPADSR